MASEEHTQVEETREAASPPSAAQETPAIGRSEPLFAHEARIPPDTTTVMGTTFPFSIYTLIFVVLGVLTVIEVLVGTGLSGAIIGILLGMIALTKASLVVAYYMHLRFDPRILTYTLVIPLIIGIVSILWLLIVPPTGY